MNSSPTHAEVMQHSKLSPEGRRSRRRQIKSLDSPAMKTHQTTEKVEPYKEHFHIPKRPRFCPAFPFLYTDDSVNDECNVVMARSRTHCFGTSEMVFVCGRVFRHWITATSQLLPDDSAVPRRLFERSAYAVSKPEVTILF